MPPKKKSHTPTSHATHPPPTSTKLSSSEIERGEAIALEVEALQSIYGDDFHLLSTTKEHNFPVKYTLQLFPTTDVKNNYVSVQLTVVWSLTNNVPVLVCTKEQGLSDEQIQTLQKQIDQYVEERKSGGDVENLVFSISTLITDYLQDHNVPQQSFHEQMVAHQSEQLRLSELQRQEQLAAANAVVERQRQSLAKVIAEEQQKKEEQWKKIQIEQDKIRSQQEVSISADNTATERTDSAAQTMPSINHPTAAAATVSSAVKQATGTRTNHRPQKPHTDHQTNAQHRKNTQQTSKERDARRRAKKYMEDEEHGSFGGFVFGQRQNSSQSLSDSESGSHDEDD